MHYVCLKFRILSYYVILLSPLVFVVVRTKLGCDLANKNFSKMQYLETPFNSGQRSNSQTNFIIEDDLRSERSDVGEDRGFPIIVPGITFGSPLKNIPLKLKALIGTLSATTILLTIALIVVSFLYWRTFDHYEICRSRECTNTATLFIKTMDDSVDPCEDFHKFACGNWITDISAVAAVPLYDHTNIMRSRVVGRLKGLMEDISEDDIEILRQIKILHRSCVDLETIELAGLKPLIDLLEKYYKNGDTLAQMLAKIRRDTGQSYLFDITIASSYQNTSVKQIFIDQPELPVDKETFAYTTTSSSAYERLVTKVFTKIGKTLIDGDSTGFFKKQLNNITRVAEVIVGLEELFSMSGTDDDDQTKASKLNLFTLRELNRIYSNQSAFGPMGFSNDSHFFSRVARDVSTRAAEPNPHFFNWTEYIETLFGDTSTRKITDAFRVNVNDLTYLRKVAKILLHVQPEEMKMYVIWQLLYSFGKDVTQDFRQLFNTFASVAEGTDKAPNRGTECIELIDKSLPFALTHKYVKKYVNHTILDETSDMVKNIITAFKEMVTELDWMDSNTKKRALLKADMMKVYIGYPKWLEDSKAVDRYHHGLRFTRGEFFSNMVTMMKWTSMKEIKEFYDPVDPTWSSHVDSPVEADAFYDDELNSITFPSGFLQGPFIGMGLKSIDYGALGSVVGHEVTHGFDTEGRYSDEYGRLNSWWSLETMSQFVRKTTCFVKQYGNYWFPELGSEKGTNNTINGRRTLAENIADNGGIREALRAYRLYASKLDKPEPRLQGLEKYSPEKLFFLSFAQSWCSYMNPPALVDMIESNVHSPPRYRIIGTLSNFQDFSDVWDCPENSFMNPETKCILW